MKYELVNATKEEVLKINVYVENNIPIEIFNYKIVKSDNEKTGCLLVTKKMMILF